MTKTYIVSVPSEDGTPIEHTVETDAEPSIVDRKGLTFTLGGAVQAPSPFPVWYSCVEA